MSKSNAFETALLSLIFNGDAIANLADDASSSPLTDLYVSLHTADPGEAGDQESNECAYTSYARVAVSRDSSGWTVSGNTVNLTTTTAFPAATGGSETATHFGAGSAATGGGVLYYSGALDSSIVISSGVTPRLTTSTAVTED